MAGGLKARLPCPPGCAHEDSDGHCEYLRDTGRCRGCPPGPDCVRFEPSDGSRPRPAPPPQPRHETEGYVRRPTAVRALEHDPRAIAMWEAGATDREIADATGWAPSTVRKWRAMTGRLSRRSR